MLLFFALSLPWAQADLSTSSLKELLEKVHSQLENLKKLPPQDLLAQAEETRTTFQEILNRFQRPESSTIRRGLYKSLGNESCNIHARFHETKQQLLTVFQSTDGKSKCFIAEQDHVYFRWNKDTLSWKGESYPQDNRSGVRSCTLTIEPVDTQTFRFESYCSGSNGVKYEPLSQENFYSLTFDSDGIK